jgi:probable F420-dependent oxidoreductase
MVAHIKFDAALQSIDNLLEIPAIAESAEKAGISGLWSSEINHDPFIQLAFAASKTTQIELGTSIALSFTRSPMVLAQTCWDLAALSKGRFILGLGTQVKAHNERRFSIPWSSPLPRLREVILSLRAIWDSWRTGERLNFRGEHYTFTLMTPFFTPPRHAYPIPVTIAGVNTGLCKLAGELCEGFHVHPLNSERYIREVIRPAIEEGASSAGRGIDDVKLITSVFVVTGETESDTNFTREFVRQQISFYASTPSYHVIFETHGWGEIAEHLSRLAARKLWGDMPALITDEMIETFAIVGGIDTIAERALKRYHGLVDRIAWYLPYQPGRFDRLWSSSIAAFASQ